MPTPFRITSAPETWLPKATFVLTATPTGSAETTPIETRFWLYPAFANSRFRDMPIESSLKLLPRRKSRRKPARKRWHDDRA